MTTEDLATRPISAPESSDVVLASAVSRRGSSSSSKPSSKRSSSRSNSQPGADGPGLSHGDFVGRYSILSHLGRGGMGVVYKAYDPQLDRNVAIKLLRRARASVEADLRLLREAQTLARLKHPNIVAVYDAGLASQGVFIAMELLEGRTVNKWLGGKTRSIREILEVFHAAGQGLVAAHDAGFIHRDFKPGNVHIDEDGVVKVLDFGLAHAVDGEPAPRQGTSSDEVEVGEPVGTDPSRRGAAPVGSGTEDETREVRRTPEGEALMGTPAYMAPEEFSGRTDHRSDQFAFCMSLYVALFDRPPFAGETYEQRVRGIRKGLTVDERELDRAASGERVSPRIRRVLLRGLAVDPAERFPSMDALLSELAEPPRRWHQALAAATLLMGFGVGAMVFGEGSQEDPCADPAAALEGAWGIEDRTAVEAVLLRGINPSLRSALGRAEVALDTYARDWVTMYEDSCRATFVSHQQSEQLFDQRMRCLQRRRNRFRSTIDSLAAAEGQDELLRQIVLPFKLPAIQDCADLDLMMNVQPLPDDRGLQARIAELRVEIDRADTLYDAGDLQGGLAIMEPVVEEARRLDYLPLLAESLWTLGRIEASISAVTDAEQTLREAIAVAARAGDERSEAGAWISLLFSVTRQRRYEEGLVLELAARTAVDRAGDEVLRGWLLNNLGVFYAEHGDYDEALPLLREAIDTKVGIYGAEHIDVGISWVNLGNALADYERFEDARDAFGRARTIFGSTVGTSHPMTSYALSGMCRVELAHGNAEEAVALCSEVVRAFEEAPPNPTWAGRISFILAQAQWATGRHELAQQTARDAQRIIEEDDPDAAEKIGRWLSDPDGFDEDDEPSEESEPDRGEGESTTGGSDGGSSGSTG